MVSHLSVEIKGSFISVLILSIKNWVHLNWKAPNVARRGDSHL
jgi:hypothetical protein